MTDDVESLRKKLAEAEANLEGAINSSYYWAEAFKTEFERKRQAETERDTALAAQSQAEAACAEYREVLQAVYDDLNELPRDPNSGDVTDETQEKLEATLASTTPGSSLLAEVERLRNPWQDIAIAPKGKRVFTLYGSYGVAVCYQTNHDDANLMDTWRYAEGPLQGQQAPWPSFWMNIPLPPVSQQAESAPPLSSPPAKATGEA